MIFGGLIAQHWSWQWIFYFSGKTFFNKKPQVFFDDRRVIVDICRCRIIFKTKEKTPSEGGDRFFMRVNDFVRVNS